MLRLRQYKEADAKKIAQWVQDKDVFQKWGGDLFGEYPIDSDFAKSRIISIRGSLLTMKTVWWEASSCVI